MDRINDTQQRIYEYLMERSQDGVPPSVREIGAAVGLKSTSSVQANLDALEAAGYITRDPMLKRSIRINGQAENVTHVLARHGHGRSGRSWRWSKSKVIVYTRDDGIPR